jgi:transcriptional regulator with XRE-family HTH domain
MVIGEKLKRLRKMLDLTLDDIAKKSGVGKATLSRIENNITAGTLKTHMRICEALNINLKDLYEGLDAPHEDISSFSEKKADEAEIFSYDERAKSIILTKNAQKKNMLPQLLILEQNGKTHLEQNAVGSEKFVFCTEGKIQMVIEKKSYELKKSTSLYFNSALPHHFINIGKKISKCLVITSPVAL